MFGHSYSEAEVAIIRDLYPMKTAKHVADILGRTERSIYMVANRLGIKKDPLFFKTKGLF